MLRRVLFASSVIAVLTAGGCLADSSSGFPDEEAAGTPGGTGAFGYACSFDAPCRIGLVCSSQGRCEFGRTLPEGNACKASNECAEGLFCGPARTCARVGTGTAGATCATDGDCAGGLRCSLQGLVSSCQPEGKSDIGSSCKVSGECFAGLVCKEQKCAPPAPGEPPFTGGSWKGVGCATDEPADQAIFRLPSGPGDEFYALPFPSDLRTQGGRPDLSGHPTPGADLLGFDAVGRYLQALGQTAGFGAYGTIFFRFGSLPEVESIAKALRVVDVTEGPTYGQAAPFGWYAYSAPNKYMCANWLGLRPPRGVTLAAGHTYAAFLTNDAKTSTGQPFRGSDDLALVLSETPPINPDKNAAYAVHAPLRAYLKKQNLPATSVVTGTVFTVGSPRQPAEQLAAAVAAQPVPAAGGWVKCGSGPSPCAGEGDRACGQPGDAFDELHARIDLPIFQAGQAPYATPEDGGAISSQAPTRVEQVCASLTVPKGTMPEAGWPVVVYAHGTGGNFRSHITEGVAAALAKVDHEGQSLGFAVLGIDQVQHGPRRGASTASPDELFFNFANPAAALGNPLQGAADQLSLGRFVRSFGLGADVSPTGAEIRFGPALFWGHSQGATEGGISLPYSPDFLAAVFSGQGAGLLDSLVTKTSPVNIAAILPFALQDPDPLKPTAISGGVYHPVLSLLQMFIEPADPVTHAPAFHQPPAGAVPKHIFQVYGTGDTFSTAPTQETFAVAAALGLVAPDPSASTPEPIGGLMPQSKLSGNLSVGAQPMTFAVKQFGPTDKYDGHFVAFRNENARKNIVRFLADVALGKTPQVSTP